MQALKKLARKYYDRNEAFIRKLRRQGARVGKNVQIVDRAKLSYEPWYANLLEIGDGVVISSGVRLVTHDSSYANIAGDLPIKYGRVIIERNAYIGVNAIILPGVRIGEHSLIGAGSVVTRDVPPRSVAGGNPAKVLGTLEQGLSRYQERIVRNDAPGVYYLDLGGSYRQMHAKWGNKVADEILARYAAYRASGMFE